MNAESDLATIAAYPTNFRLEALALWTRARQSELSPLTAFAEMSALCGRYDGKLDTWTRRINVELHRAGRPTPLATQLMAAVTAAREQLRATALNLVTP